MIPIFGEGGTGKTTLAQVLAREFDPYRSGAPRGYKLSLDYEHDLTYSYKGNVWATFVGLAGQRQFRGADSTWRKYLKKIEDGSCCRFVHVCSYGFHSIGYSWRYHPLAEERDDGTAPTKSEFIAAFTAEQRDREIEVVRDILKAAAKSESTVRMMTFVAKQDLWWEQRKEVKNFYELSGDYAEVVKDAASDAFTHSTVSCSLVHRNFRDGHGNILANTAAGYESETRLANLDYSLKGIRSLFTRSRKR